MSGIDSLGETNEVQWSSSPLSVSVTGKCSLAFTGQPAQTAVNSDILTGFNSTGSPLAVQLLDANNDVLNPADFSANGTQVTVSIETNPGGGTLAGTTTVASSNGVADFGNLQINKAGSGYDLAATHARFQPGHLELLQHRRTDPGLRHRALRGIAIDVDHDCVAATSSASGNFVALGLGGVTLTCNHYNAVSDVAAFGVLNSSGGNVANSSRHRHPYHLQGGRRVGLASALPMAGLLRVADALPGDLGHERDDRHRRHHLPHRTAAALFPVQSSSSGALPHLAAPDAGGRGPADLCRSRGSLRARVTCTWPAGSVAGDRPAKSADVGWGGADLPGLRRGEP